MPASRYYDEDDRSVDVLPNKAPDILAYLKAWLKNVHRDPLNPGLPTVRRAVDNPTVRSLSAGSAASFGSFEA